MDLSRIKHERADGAPVEPHLLEERPCSLRTARDFDARPVRWRLSRVAKPSDPQAVSPPAYQLRALMTSLESAVLITTPNRRYLRLGNCRIAEGPEASFPLGGRLPRSRNADHDRSRHAVLKDRSGETVAAGKRFSIWRHGGNQDTAPDPPVTRSFQQPRPIPRVLILSPCPTEASCPRPPSRTYRLRNASIRSSPRPPRAFPSS